MAAAIPERERERHALPSVRLPLHSGENQRRESEALPSRHQRCLCQQSHSKNGFEAHNISRTTVTQKRFLHQLRQPPAALSSTEDKRRRGKAF